jgi:hypothetical protein
LYKTNATEMSQIGIQTEELRISKGFMCLLQNYLSN